MRSLAPIMILLALTASAQYPSSIDVDPDVGDILVQAPAGYEIKLDGKSFGVVPEGETGMVLREVVGGMHIVEILKPAGAGHSRYDVEVRKGGTATVFWPSMAASLRPRAASKTGDLEIRVPTSPCRAFIAGEAHELSTRDSLVRNVPVGKKTLRVQCGSVDMEAVVEVKDGYVVPIEADLGRRRLSMGVARPRAINVVVTPSNPHAIPADLPGEWKRALSASLDGTMSEVKITRRGWIGIEITFFVGNYDDVWRFQKRISERSEVTLVTWVDFVRTGGNGGRARFQIDFGSNGEG